MVTSPTTKVVIASTIALANSAGGAGGHRGERRTDHPGAVFARDHEHAEYRENEFAEAGADRGVGDGLALLGGRGQR